MVYTFGLVCTGSRTRDRLYLSLKETGIWFAVALRKSLYQSMYVNFVISNRQCHRERDLV